MDIVIGGIAFALMIGAQFLAVVVAHNARCHGEAAGQLETGADSRARNIWQLGS
jgi:hypothetical protein